MAVALGLGLGLRMKEERPRWVENQGVVELDCVGLHQIKTFDFS